MGHSFAPCVELVWTSALLLLLSCYDRCRLRRRFGWQLSPTSF